LPQFGKISQNFAGFIILHNGAGRNNDFQIHSTPTGAVVAGAVSTVFGDLMLLVFQIQERMVTFRCAKNDVAAFAAVTAVGAAFGDKLFPPETHAACAAVSAFYKNLCFVNKFHNK